MTTPYNAVPEDDEFHPFDPTDWWHVETVWFAFTVPEKSLNAVVYLINRPAMGIATLQVNVFDPSGFEPWANRHWRSLWHLPLPPSLRKIDMPDVGFHFEAIEPLTEYRIRYRHANAAFDVTWRAIVPPRMSGPDHIDQFGRVTGTLEIDGERVAVNCLQMRDRSWKHRSDLEDRRGGYTYALASERAAFLMASAYQGDVAIAAGGWLLRDGRMIDLAHGMRRITARGPAGQPLRVEVEGVDRDGRQFSAVGESISRSIMHTCGNILAWDSVMRWRLDGEECWGEDQDVFHPECWGDFPTAAAGAGAPARSLSKSIG